MEINDSFDQGVLDWLLEEENPCVRYLAMRDLLDISANHPDMIKVRETAHRQGNIAKILSAMHPEGYWEKPGPGYGPKYRSTVWALILLAQLGADVHEDPRIKTASDYLFTHTWHPQGQFSAGEPTSYTIDCLQGNLCWALTSMGIDDLRLDKAYEWMARTVTGEGIAPKGDKKAEMRYFAYKCGPGFQCGANYNQPCAWGATKVMLAFSSLPKSKRTPLIENAIQQGIEFFFSIDPVTALWPTENNKPPNRDWWLFGFPLFYITDLLQVAEALSALGYGSDPRMQGLRKLIIEKKNPESRWLLEYAYGSKTWGHFGLKNKPSKWVTLRALRALKD